ncbi:MAG: hypothetical protein MZV64_18035 [Ignavibacteriales bacterium]|nr:hypothetical protein [Ignavibacteriales bacterium]
MPGRSARPSSTPTRSGRRPRRRNSWPVRDPDRHVRGPGRGAARPSRLALTAEGRSPDGPLTATPAARPTAPSSTSTTTSRARCPSSRRSSSAVSSSAATTRPRPEMEGWDPIFSRWPKWSESLHLHLYPGKPPVLLEQPDIALRFRLPSTSAAGSDGHAHGPCAWARSTPQPGLVPRRRPASGAARSCKGRLNYKISKFLTRPRDLGALSIPGVSTFRGAASYNWLQFELIFRY